MTKQHILNEIKRTATANGGKALGRARFFTETGIKESDWSGRYWTTWNAALAEAGFPPNRLNGAYNDDLLLQRLGELVRDLGRFLVAAEFRLRRRTDPTFPDQKTYRRFGRKGALARQLLDYSLANGLEEVAALCEPHIDEESPTPSPRPERVLGDVYLI